MQKELQFILRRKESTHLANHKGMKEEIKNGK